MPLSYHAQHTLRERATRGCSKDEVPANLQALVAPHIESYNWFIEQGMHEAVDALEPVEIADERTGQPRLRLWFEAASVGKPTKEGLHHGGAAASGAASTASSAHFCRDHRLFPNQCREGAATYRAAMTINLVKQVGDYPPERYPRNLGHLPVMVRSCRCNLEHNTQAQQVRRKEDATEMGGYFIVNGNEKLLRLLVVPRRHYVQVFKRSAYYKRGSNYTDLASVVRCVRPDQSGLTVRVHYLTDGSSTFAFAFRRQEFLVPVGIVLKALVDTTDKHIFDCLLQCDLVEEQGQAVVLQRAEILLRKVQDLQLYTRVDCLSYLGKKFRVLMDAPQRFSDAKVGELLLQQMVMVHLRRNQDKFNLLVLMLAKLYAVVDGNACPDNEDATANHEVLLPGHTLCMLFKERLQELLQRTKTTILQQAQALALQDILEEEKVFRQVLQKCRMDDLGARFDYLLATGNLVSQSGLDLQQQSGYAVVAEKINYHRFLSHFRSIHRGASFSQLRTTTPRKLLPESWGFLCPVHTPDGDPCGLLNHLSRTCQVVCEQDDDPATQALQILTVLHEGGMIPEAERVQPLPLATHLTVSLDGAVVGYTPRARAKQLVSFLRVHKVTMGSGCPEHLEVACVPFVKGGTFPGIFIFTQPSRFVRPVQQLATGSIEMIGSLEQASMNILVPERHDVGSQVDVESATHSEVESTAILSVVANLTPWSHHNQSPRNMYQCQMAKQTLGTPCATYQHRADTKMYRLHTPQVPICRTEMQDRYHMDDYPAGTNAIVAVLAYTGYDMEDAMIINKSSMERGFAHGTLYKTEVIDLHARRKGTAKAVASHSFGVRDKSSHLRGSKKQFSGVGELDVDGLPHAGAIVNGGSVYCSEIDKSTGREKLHKLKGEERAMIEQVTIIGDPADTEIQKASIRMKFNRNPVIGDKFSSRHGQKGVLSQLWPDIDMPFTRDGVRPDLLINPHAFPSRMTIGMLIESLAGKTGAMCGTFPDASTWRETNHPQSTSDGIKSGMASSDAEPPVLGSQNGFEGVASDLVRHGFSYVGSEAMTSGITGEPFEVDIFIGCVYYQRLRHMVSDKYQVRSLGPVNQLTRQPIKGRKVGGGIRFGEMERDSLLAHGAAYLLHDRLHTCSDYHTCDVCSRCGSLLSTVAVKHPLIQGSRTTVTCTSCQSAEFVERVALPYVFRFLVTELAAMNIRVSLTLD